MRDLSRYAAYRRTPWRFSILHAMVATALAVMPFAIYRWLPIIGFADGWVLIPLSGACWGCGIGFLRSGPVGAVVGAILGSSLLTFGIILLLLIFRV